MAAEAHERVRCGACGQFGAHCSRGGELVACDNCWELVCGKCMEYDPEENEQCCPACVAAITTRLASAGASPRTQAGEGADG